MKKYYFINKFNTNNIDKQDGQTAIIFRNYSSKKINEDLIVRIKNYCKKKTLKFYLSNDIKIEETFCFSLILISAKLCADPINLKFFFRLYELCINDLLKAGM